MNRRGFFGRLAQIGAGAVAAKVVKLPEPEVGAPEPQIGVVQWPGTYTYTTSAANGGVVNGVFHYVCVHDNGEVFYSDGVSNRIPDSRPLK